MKKKRAQNLAPRCPYCGSHSVLRSADGIYRNNDKSAMLYVCSRYPMCDSYVRVHPGTKIPVGTMANRELRALRNEAHRNFDQLHKKGLMSKEDAYPDRSPYYPEMSRRDAYALSAIICNKMGWVRGNVSDFGDYGRQKSFYKEPPKIDFEPL